MEPAFTVVVQGQCYPFLGLFLQLSPSVWSDVGSFDQAFRGDIIKIVFF